MLARTVEDEILPGRNPFVGVNHPHCPVVEALDLDRVRGRIDRADGPGGPNRDLDRNIVEGFGRKFLGIQGIGVAHESTVALEDFVVGQPDPPFPAGRHREIRAL